MQTNVLPKQQYNVVVELAAPIEDCFLAASREDAMMQWVPNPKSIVYDHSKASEPYGVGSERLVTLNSGFSLLERIHISDSPEVLIGYHIPSFGFIGDMYLKRYQGYMYFEAIDDNKTRLTWKGYFECSSMQKITEPLVRRLFTKLITTMANNQQTYLSGVKTPGKASQ